MSDWDTWWDDFNERYTREFDQSKERRQEREDAEERERKRQARLRNSDNFAQPPWSMKRLRAFEKEKHDKKYNSIKCPATNFVPHHRNLGVKPWASDEQIRAAWKNIIMRLHPDKIHDPEQKRIASKASVLVNDAYESLLKSKQNQGPGYQHYEDWTADQDIDILEWKRRIDENTNALTCASIANSKPWHKEYKTYDRCEKDADIFCDEFTVNLVHKLVDNVLPVSKSDEIWDKKERVKRKKSRKTHTLKFYGSCYQEPLVIELRNLAVADEIPRWSSFRGLECAETPLHWNTNDGYVLIAVLIALLSLVGWISLVLFEWLKRHPTQVKYVLTQSTKVFFWPFKLVAKTCYRALPPICGKRFCGKKGCCGCLCYLLFVIVALPFLCLIIFACCFAFYCYKLGWRVTLANLGLYPEEWE
jgi:hypothetical protein